MELIQDFISTGFFNVLFFNLLDYHVTYEIERNNVSSSLFKS